MATDLDCDDAEVWVEVTQGVDFDAVSDVPADVDTKVNIVLGVISDVTMLLAALLDRVECAEVNSGGPDDGDLDIRISF